MLVNMLQKRKDIFHTALVFFIAREYAVIANLSRITRRCYEVAVLHAKFRRNWTAAWLSSAERGTMLDFSWAFWLLQRLRF